MKINDIDLKGLINKVNNNEIQYIIGRNNVVIISGYLYESSYEFFELGKEILLNNEVLYANCARSTEGYSSQKYIKGKCSSLEETIQTIKDKFNQDNEKVNIISCSELEDFCEKRENALNNKKRIRKLFQNDKEIR